MEENEERFFPAIHEGPTLPPSSSFSDIASPFLSFSFYLTSHPSIQPLSLSLSLCTVRLHPQYPHTCTLLVPQRTPQSPACGRAKHA